MFSTTRIALISLSLFLLVACVSGSQITPVSTATAPLVTPTPVVPTLALSPAYPVPFTPLPPSPTPALACAFSATFSPLVFVDNTRLLGRTDTGVSLLNLATLSEEDNWPYTSLSPNLRGVPLAIAPDGKRLVWSLTNTIEWIDLERHVVITTSPPLTTPIGHLEFSATGDKVFGMFGQDGTFVSWGLDGQPLTQFQTGYDSYHGLGMLAGMGVSADERQLAFLPLSDTLHLALWDVVAHKPITTYPAEYIGDDAGPPPGGVNVTFAPTGEWVGHGVGNGTAGTTLWRVSDGAIVWRGRNDHYAVSESNFAFSPNGHFAATATSDENNQPSVLLHTLTATSISYSTVLPLPVPFTHQARFRLIFSPDNTQLIAVTQHSLLVWEVETGTMRQACQMAR